jgi:hypothetical protein
MPYAGYKKINFPYQRNSCGLFSSIGVRHSTNSAQK